MIWARSPLMLADRLRASEPGNFSVSRIISLVLSESSGELCSGLPLEASGSLTPFGMKKLSPSVEKFISRKITRMVNMSIKLTSGNSGTADFFP